MSRYLRNISKSLVAAGVTVAALIIEQISSMSIYISSRTKPCEVEYYRISCVCLQIHWSAQDAPRALSISGSSRDLRGSCTLQHQPVTDSGLDSTALCTRLEVASHVQSRMSMPVVFNGQVDALPMAEANRGRKLH